MTGGRTVNYFPEENDAYTFICTERYKIFPVSFLLVFALNRYHFIVVIIINGIYDYFLWPICSCNKLYIGKTG